MEQKRALFLVLAMFLMTIILVSFVSAIDLEIEKKAIRDVVITELDTPAEFEFTITNNGPDDTFEMYSLVGINIYPKGNFKINHGQTKIINIEIEVLEAAKQTQGYYTFVYKIKGSNTGIQEDKVTVKIAGIKEALEISADSINTDSEKTTVYLRNKEDIDFPEMTAEFSSTFFSKKETFSLEALEKKSFEVDLNKEKLRTLVAGPYMLLTTLSFNEEEKRLESTIKFLETSGISTTGNEEGLLLYRQEIEKINEGNIPTVAEIKITKNIFSRLFTNFNLPPTRTEREGFKIIYSWNQELRPSQSLKIIAKTNWIIPIIIIIAVGVIIFLFNVYWKSNLILKKTISFVRTKGGEFALKVTITAKSRKFIEKINIVDKIPPMMKLYERYGTIAPDRIDVKNRRIEWNLENLDETEERVFSYIIYSKIGVLGKFELPPAKGIYERDGKIKETQSNRAFFISEARKTTEEE